ncbi:MAG: type II toxin-antitoxin system RelE/ParE family toxin [Tannerella sp.]|jgi:plasmid stabilization system protein ParE|nr:type II toxin-antitoxin system RelE/ParE family toxin [Tannerella sp.]
MRLNWKPEAEKTLDDIYRFYFYKSERAAYEIAKDIRDAAKKLKTFPYLASVEPDLEGFSETLRALVVRRLFKIIYYVDNNEIVIVTVWDCRQNPQTLKTQIKKLK